MSVQATKDSGSAVSVEDGCWGRVSFVDYMSLAKVEGVWKIVAKTFAHTGGQMPF